MTMIIDNRVAKELLRNYANYTTSYIPLF